MIETIQDVENFSNKYRIPMLYEENLPRAFTITIFHRDELFVRSWIEENKGVHTLFYFRVLADRHGTDKKGLLEGLRDK